METYIIYKFFKYLTSPRCCKSLLERSVYKIEGTPSHLHKGTSTAATSLVPSASQLLLTGFTLSNLACTLRLFSSDKVSARVCRRSKPSGFWDNRLRYDLENGIKWNGWQVPGTYTLSTLLSQSDHLNPVPTKNKRVWFCN